MPSVSLFRPTIVKKGKKTKGRYWHAAWRDERGKRRTVTTKKKYRRPAEQFAANLQLDLEMGGVGLSDPFAKHKVRPLIEHLKDFEQDKLNDGKSRDYVACSKGRIERLLTGCGFKTTADIEATKVNAYLAQQRASGKSRTKGKGLDAATSNHILTAAGVFFNWMVTHGRMAENPLVRGGTSIIERHNPEDDRRRERRSLTLEEFYKLLDSAAAGPPIQGLVGADRRVLYIVAAYTGFRRRELGSLVPSSFSLDSMPPTLTVKVRDSKRRKLDKIPLRLDLAEIIREWLWSRGPLPADRPVLPVSRRRTAKMIRLDLERVGIQYIDDQGIVADFHGLRRLLASSANRAGVSLTTAQRLMRHSTPTLTANTYTDVALQELADAVEKLPPPERPKAGPAGEGQEPESGLVACNAACNRACNKACNAGGTKGDSGEPARA